MSDSSVIEGWTNVKDAVQLDAAGDKVFGNAMGPIGRRGGGERRGGEVGCLEGGGGEETEARGQAAPGGRGQEGDQEAQVGGTKVRDINIKS